MEPEPQLRRQTLLLGVLVEGGLGVLACVLRWAFGQPVWERWHWQGRDAVLGVVASLPMLLAFGLCFWWPVGPLGRIKQFCEEIIRPLFAACSILDLALISALAGVGEEMLFRGVLQEVLGARLNPWLGLAAASVVFGLFHPITPAYIVLATGMGAYLGALWLATGNLLTVSVTHGLYDFLVLVYLVNHGPRVRAGER
jgi:membrane protease YdiL (CAAX protease family)